MPESSQTKDQRKLSQIESVSRWVEIESTTGTPTADLLTVKLLLDSVISTAHAKFMTIDIKDFYLMTPMDCYEYFKMKLDLFPEDIVEEYDLRNKVDDRGFVIAR